MKIVLVITVLLQVIVSIQSEGLARSLAELSAFLLVVAIMINHKQQKDARMKLKAE